MLLESSVHRVYAKIAAKDPADPLTREIGRRFSGTKKRVVGLEPLQSEPVAFAQRLGQKQLQGSLLDEGATSYRLRRELGCV